MCDVVCVCVYVCTQDEILVHVVSSDNILLWGDNGETVARLAGFSPASQLHDRDHMEKENVNTDLLCDS